MREILLSDTISPDEKELELFQFFNGYTPKTSPFLLGEFALTKDDYQNLSDYFRANHVTGSFYRYPIIFAFLITEFAYWTDEWESRNSFWQSFQDKFKIAFNQNIIYQTIKRGYRQLNVIAQPKSGFRYVNWCTMQSILGRNAVRRLAELIQYWKRKNIKAEQIKEAFEESYIVDLKLAVLSHLYQIEPNIVLQFLSDLVKGDYQNCIYFRNDAAFINQFEDLLKQRLFYYGIFSSDSSYNKEPILFLEDNCIKCQFIEGVGIRPENVDIKRYKGQNIIANYRNNRRFTRWEKSNLVWEESFNTFLQSKNQTIEFYLENSDERIFEIPLLTLKDKDCWIFSVEGDLLNEKEDEINILLQEDTLLQLVTTHINDLENLNVIDHDRYADEEQYFILKFKPNPNLLKETIGNNVLIYELPESVHFSCTLLFTNSNDNLSVLNELPEIYFNNKISKEKVFLDINGEEIPQKKILENAVDDNSYWILNIEQLYNWKCFGENRITILHEKSLKDICFSFYYIRDLNIVKMCRLKDHHEIVFEFCRRNHYKIKTTAILIPCDPKFTIRSEQSTGKLDFNLQRLKSDDEITLGIQTVTPDASIIYKDNQVLDSKQITLPDLINLPITIILRGQPKERFGLQLVSEDSRILCNFGNDFKFSDKGTFRIGKLFWQKYYSETKKKLHDGSAFLRFAYDYSIPYSKPFLFDIAQIFNQKPTVKQYDISVLDKKLSLQLEVEKLPLNSLKLFLFSSDFSDQRSFSIENTKRLPSETLKIQETITIPDFADNGITYAGLTVNDRMLNGLKQLVLGGSQELNPLASFIDFLYRNFVIKAEDEIHNYKLSKKQLNDLTIVFRDEQLLASFISFLYKPEIIDIFHPALSRIIGANKLLLWRLLITTGFENQMRIIRFIVESSGLGFFNLSEKEKAHLRKKFAGISWQNTGLFEKLLKVHLYGYGGLETDEAVGWLRIKFNKPVVIGGHNTAEFMFHNIEVSNFQVLCSGKYIFKFRKSHYQRKIDYDNLILEDYYNFKDENGRIRFYIDPKFKDQKFFPPRTTSNRFIKVLKDNLEDIRNSAILAEIKSGKFETASEDLKCWHNTLRKNSEKIGDLFFIFYNFWLLPESGQKRVKLEKQIIQIFKENPILFCYLMIFKELVYQWENFKWEKPDESYFKSLDHSATTEAIANEISVDPVSGQLGFFKERD